MAKKGFTMPSTKSLLDSIAGRVEEEAAETPAVQPEPPKAPEAAAPQPAPEAKRPSHTTGFYLAPDIIEKLDACALMQKKSRSEVCRLALEEYFANHQDLLDRYEKFLKL